MDNFRPDIRYRSIKQDGGGELLIPECSRRIDRHQIPQSSVTLAAALFRLRTPRVLRHALGQHMLFIPELRDSGIGEAPEGDRSRTSPVGCQYRLPDRKHA